MKKGNIRKPTVYAAILGAALCFSACGINAEETPNTFLLENPASTEPPEQVIDAPEGNPEASAESDDPANSTENDEKNDTNVSNSGSSVTVVMKTENDTSLVADDGTVFYEITCSYPVVSIAGNEAAAEKINADIYSRVETFNTWTMQTAEYAEEDFEYWLNDHEGDYTPFPYSSDLYYIVTRADDNVISFTENGYEYTGGAHGMPYATGINYDTNTGELISFTELSDDPDAFHADTLAYNQALAQTEYYSSEMFDTANITDGTLEEVLYADGMWYLSTSGLVFMSPPYALAPYAAGTLEFTIPYSDLKGMGFKEQYAYISVTVSDLQSDS